MLQLIKYWLIVSWLVACMMPAIAMGQSGEIDIDSYDADQALNISQGAIGKPLGDLQFTDSQGASVDLQNYLGKPLLISLIFTSCYHVCPAITRHLAIAVSHAREVLGDESFNVLTIGFDTAVDSPEAMSVFASAQGVGDSTWSFLSAEQETMEQLVDNIGFVYYPSPRGFDHINQVTVVDRDGLVYRQVYGAAFDLPWLVEPLKQLVFNRPQAAGDFAANLVNRVRLFCTVFDPTTGRYRFDYSLFVQIGVGAMAILAVASWLLMEGLKSRRRKRATK
jgi:protein SCO1/2